MRANGTTHIHHSSRRRDDVAVCGAGAAADDAGHRLASRLIRRTRGGVLGSLPQRSERDWLCRGQNVSIEYRWADGQYERLSAAAGELVRRPVALILAGSPPGALAAKIATTSIPIVFVVGLDPVAAGLVSTFNHPGGNATGMTLLTGPLVQKRLEFLHELLPNATNIVMLVNPTSPDTAPEIRDAEAAAQANGLQIKLLSATTANERN